jgi:hypothetical protein
MSLAEMKISAMGSGGTLVFSNKYRFDSLDEQLQALVFLGLTMWKFLIRRESGK